MAMPPRAHSSVFEWQSIKLSHKHAAQTSLWAHSKLWLNLEHCLAERGPWREHFWRTRPWSEMGSCCQKCWLFLACVEIDWLPSFHYFCGNPPLTPLQEKDLSRQGVIKLSGRSCAVECFATISLYFTVSSKMILDTLISFWWVQSGKMFHKLCSWHILWPWLRM